MEHKCIGCTGETSDPEGDNWASLTLAAGTHSVVLRACSAGCLLVGIDHLENCSDDTIHDDDDDLVQAVVNIAGNLKDGGIDCEVSA